MNKTNFKILAIVFFSLFSILMLTGSYFSQKYYGELRLFENIKDFLLPSLLVAGILARLYPNAKKAKATKAQKIGIIISWSCIFVAVLGMAIIFSGHLIFGKILVFPSVIIGAITVFYLVITGQGRINVE